jgi:hypothetical protein
VFEHIQFTSMSFLETGIGRFDHWENIANVCWGSSLCSLSYHKIVLIPCTIFWYMLIFWDISRSCLSTMQITSNDSCKEISKRWTDEQMNRWTDEQTNKRTNEQMNRWTDEQTNRLSEQLKYEKRNPAMQLHLIFKNMISCLPLLLFRNSHHEIAIL